MSTHASMKKYVWKILKQKEAQLAGNRLTAPLDKHLFHRLTGQIDVLYTILTGWNNPQANPIEQHEGDN